MVWCGAVFPAVASRESEGGFVKVCLMPLPPVWSSTLTRSPHLVQHGLCRAFRKLFSNSLALWLFFNSRFFNPQRTIGLPAARPRGRGGEPNRNPTNRRAATVSALVLPLPRSCHRTQADGPPRLPPTMPRFLRPQGPDHGPRSPTIQTPFSLRSAVDVSVQWSRKCPRPLTDRSMGRSPARCARPFSVLFSHSHIVQTRITAHARAAGHAAAALHPAPTERTAAGAPTSARTTTRLRTASVSLLNHPSPPHPDVN